MGMHVRTWAQAKRHWLIGLAYLASYVALDWASYVHPFGRFAITPWNPQTGLSFALILLSGKRFLPLLFVSPLLADLIVRGLPVPLFVAVLLSVIVGAGYATATLALLDRRLGFQIELTRQQDVWILLLAAVTSTAAVACLYVAVLAAAVLIPWSDFGVAAQRLWVGDVIGIAVVTPLLLLMTAGRKFRPSWETLTQFEMCPTSPPEASRK
jgi:two-component system, LuxR family, sensor kinase FixL